MMLSKQTLLLCVMFFSVLISGCAGYGTGVTEESLRFGTDGVDLQVLPHVFQNDVYAGSEHTMSFSLSNEGAADVTSGVIVLETEAPYVTVQGNSKRSFFLRGRSPLFPDGEIIDMSFRTSISSLDPGSVKHESVLFLTACYDYQTKLTVDICIDPDPNGLRQHPDGKQCTASDITPGSQGAPIAVTKVELRPYLSDDERYLPEFIFHVENKRDGLPFTYDQVRSICSTTTVAESDLNRIQLFAKVSESVLACDKPITKLVQGKAVIRCGFQNVDLIPADVGAYTAPLYVELNYGYTETLTQKFDIVR